MDYDYLPPVDKLLTYGEPPTDTFPNYLDLGFTSAQVQDLIRMATDETLLSLEDTEAVEGWAPIHAWRTLQQLHAEEALVPLTKLFDLEDDEKISVTGITEWVSEEIPDLYASFGTTAIPVLKTYIEDMNHENPFAVSNASNALVAIAKQASEVRDDCLLVIRQRLEHFEENDELLNAFLIGDLAMDFKATDTLPLIKRVFEANRVDETFIDLEDVLIGMGLKQERDTPRKSLLPNFPFLSDLPDAPRDFDRSEIGFVGLGKSEKKSKKAKRKQAKKSQKINRKKKKK